MKIKIYISTEDIKVITEAEYERERRTLTDEYIADKEFFYEWLEETWGTKEIWELEHRENILEAWEEYCIALVETDIEQSWQVFELDI